MITYDIKKHNTDEIGKTLLTAEELLKKIKIPYHKYLQQCNDEYEKDLIIDTIIDDLCELEDDINDISVCTIINEPIRLSKPIRIIEHIIEDENHTDRGIELLSYTLGYELIC